MPRTTPTRVKEKDDHVCNWVSQSHQIPVARPLPCSRVTPIRLTRLRGPVSQLRCCPPAELLPLPRQALQAPVKRFSSPPLHPGRALSAWRARLTTERLLSRIHDGSHSKPQVAIAKPLVLSSLQNSSGSEDEQPNVLPPSPIFQFFSLSHASLASRLSVTPHLQHPPLMVNVPDEHLASICTLCSMTRFLTSCWNGRCNTIQSFLKEVSNQASNSCYIGLQNSWRSSSWPRPSATT